MVNEPVECGATAPLWVRLRRWKSGAVAPHSKSNPFNDDIDRRRFLGFAGCAAVLAAAGEWLGVRAEAEIRSSPEITLPDLSMLTPDEAHEITAADGRATLVVKLDGGDVVAFDRRCPHLGCPVLWSREHARFECPCHHAAFDARTGGVLFGPPRHGLTPAIVRNA